MNQPHRLLAALLASTLAASCATSAPEKPAKQVWLGNASPNDGPAASNLAPDELIGTEGWSADRIAGTFREPKRCEAAARARYPLDGQLAVEVIRTCIRHHKFGLLRRVLAEPWRSELRARPELIRDLALVLATRGNDLDSDTREIVGAGVPLLGLADALQGRNRDIGRHVVIRGKLLSVEGEGTKRYSLVLEEYKAATREQKVLVGHDNRGNKIFSYHGRDDSAESGEVAWVRLDRSYAAPDSAAERLYFGRLDGFERRTGEADDVAVVKPLVTVLEAFEIDGSVPVTE